MYCFCYKSVHHLGSETKRGWEEVGTVVGGSCGCEAEGQNEGELCDKEDSMVCMQVSESQGLKRVIDVEDGK